MGNTKAGQESIRTLSKAGTGSYQVTLPIGLVRALGWKEGQRVVVKGSGKKLTVEDWKPSK